LSIKRFLNTYTPVVGCTYRSGRHFKRWIEFHEEFLRFRSLHNKAGARFPLRWRDRLPFLDDRTSETYFDRHYVLHTGWAARVVAGLAPAVHVDISSSLFFCSVLSAHVRVEFYDYRPVDLGLSNLESKRADLCNLHFENASVRSLSCMHVVEHIGLGRYGDRINPDGDLIAIAELKRVLARDGTLIFVVPVGKPRVRFNAHRIYSYGQIADYFSDLDLVECALLPDDYHSRLVSNPPRILFDEQAYGCGCFVFKKRC
jgi:SAM-dependent methyltransferase